jgi:hypothetical protein
LAFGIGGAFGDGIDELAQEAAKGIDTRGAGFFLLLADAVQLLELLLFDGAHGDGADALAAMGFQEDLGINAVGCCARNSANLLRESRCLATIRCWSLATATSKALRHGSQTRSRFGVVAKCG